MTPETFTAAWADIVRAMLITEAETFAPPRSPKEAIAELQETIAYLESNLHDRDTSQAIAINLATLAARAQRACECLLRVDLTAADLDDILAEYSPQPIAELPADHATLAAAAFAA